MAEFLYLTGINLLISRQAQAAVLEAIPRLHSMNIKTKRPEDYFAQMAKADEHMNKIRTKLLSKEQGQERAEKMSKLRELKKYGKKVQVEVQQKKLKEKKDMMDEMKKIRNGATWIFWKMEVEMGTRMAVERGAIEKPKEREIQKTKSLDLEERKGTSTRMTRIQMMFLALNLSVRAVVVLGGRGSQDLKEGRRRGKLATRGWAKGTD